MSIRTALMRTASFAHLPGFSAKKMPEADPADGDAAADDADGKKARAKKKADGAGDTPDKGGETGDEDNASADDEAAAKKAADDEAAAAAKRARAADDDELDDDDKDEEGDDESDETELKGKKGKRAQNARLRERARCAAIFGCEAAGQDPRMAAHYAFDTKMTRGDAINALTKHVRAGGLAARMANVTSPRIPGGAGQESAGPGDDKAIQASWDVAFSKTRARR